MSKTSKGVPEDKLALFDKLVDTHPDIERKGKNMPYTSMNGHMYTIMTKEGMLGIRLSKEDRAAFLEKYNTELLKNYGAVMKEYVTVPDDLLHRTDELQPYLALSHTYIKSLKPKPTTKKKK